MNGFLRTIQVYVVLYLAMIKLFLIFHLYMDLFYYFAKSGEQNGDKNIVNYQ